MFKQLLLTGLLVLTASQSVLSYPVHVKGHWRDGHWVNSYIRDSPNNSVHLVFVEPNKPVYFDYSKCGELPKGNDVTIQDLVEFNQCRIDNLKSKL